MPEKRFTIPEKMILVEYCGGNKKNIPEAKIVSKAVFDHYRNCPEQTLGIGTFSQAQQTAILDELEILRRSDLSLEHFFEDDREELFFVKNLETIQGEGGIKVVPDVCLKGLREICDEHNLLLILDEVQCGIGRTGNFFAFEKSGIVPDIVPIAK